MFFLVGILSLVGSLLTFYSGFGLGTILLPVFMLFFSIEESIALVAVVHFLNNVLKFILIGKNVDGSLFLRFGLPSVIGAFMGAFILKNTGESIVLFSYALGSKIYQVQLIKLVIGILMLGFTIMEFFPTIKVNVSKKQNVFIGGLASGFFGGLSGHQGALRSLFLIKLANSKESLLATGVAIACMVDITRMSIYFKNIQHLNIASHLNLLAVACICAFAGAFVGSKLLKKITLSFVQNISATFIVIIALLLISGLL